MATISSRTVEGLKNRRHRLQAEDDQLYGEMNGLQSKIDAILQSSTPPFSIDGVNNTSALRQLYEQLVHECSDVTIKTADVETALMCLRELQSTPMRQRRSVPHVWTRDAAEKPRGADRASYSLTRRKSSCPRKSSLEEKKFLSERSSILDNLSHYSTSMDAINVKRSDLLKRIEEASFEIE